MGSDLVSACIFCAGMLLGVDLTPRPGLGGEMGFSYATMARRYDVTDTRVDSSDVTPKFVLIDLGNAKQAPDGFGAGTPAFQWEARVAFGASHDEQERKVLEDLERIVSTGTGRYENFAILGRYPIAPTDSVELAVNRRAESATDLVNIGGSNHSFSEERTLSASRGDVAVGWRHRWKGLEAEAAFRWSKPAGFNATAESFQQASGNLFGADAELRWRRGCWTVLLHGEYISGSLDVQREHSPEFIGHESSLPASFTVGRLGLGYSWPEADLFLTGTYDRQRLPFVSLAVLGTETVAFDSGFDPNSIAKEIYANVGFRYKLTAAIALRINVAVAWGDETVMLSDATGALAARQLDVLRRGVFGGGLSGVLGAPETSLFIGADFAIGSPR